MCDIATRQVIRDEVGQLVSGNKMFTAWDVTRIMRGHGIREKHRAMKEVVHELFSTGEMPGYDRSVLDIPARPKPFLYHPSGADPQGYRQSVGAAPAVPALPTKIAPDKDDEEDEKTDQEDTEVVTEVVRSVGKLGALYLPTRMIRDLGLAIGNKAAVVDMEQSLSISKDYATAIGAGGGGQAIGMYSVDVKGNVRLPGYILRLLSDKQGAPKYKIKLDGNRILVSAE